jgi:hypothetical protein
MKQPIVVNRRILVTMAFVNPEVVEGGSWRSFGLLADFCTFSSKPSASSQQ